MKELSIEQISLVTGGERGDGRDRHSLLHEIKDVAQYLITRNPFGLITHSEPLNAGEEAWLKEREREGARHGYNERQGGYHRGDGGRHIEN
ncbi:hypothetical protein [Vibrio cholerae]|uniref:hypothetical protein n=1 Tax=Vibrio cholerae TaxID=666 RepID=UPI00115A6938|nr:hypothetical protein [Vibrio cholerae]MDY7587606.1 hypothetical protein [Vibrio cholerae]TQP02543.1 hypothetical protein FLL97_09125 [Vibrio cholerae]